MPDLLADDRLFLGVSTKPEYLLLKYGNRHGLVTGATGTGKTVTLQSLAEGFSRAGVPVFAADIKGDLAGIALPGAPKDWMQKRAAEIGFSDYQAEHHPAMFWDLFGMQGHPVRTTISEMGPLLLARILDLNDTQEGVLNIAFKYADENGLLLLDLKDLRALLIAIEADAKAISATYGNVATASVGAVQRALLVLEQQGGHHFFGERAFEIADLMRVAPTGHGYISVLAADKIMQSPKLYATFMLWMLSELFEELPEVGDAAKPRLVFFFDEAHLLFDGATKALVDKVEQVVKLVRSKGVGVYFVTQNPIDIPDAVLSQLSNRVQHALRAYTPRDQKAVKVAAETFRANPAFDVETAITELAVGEALVSMLEDKGIPSVVERTLIRPPSGRVGPIAPEERREVQALSPVGAIYDKPIDRESAYEVLAKRAEAKAEEEARREADVAAQKAKPHPTYQDDNYGRPSRRTSTRQSPVEAALTSAARSMASQLGRSLVRGILGSLSRGR